MGGFATCLEIFPLSTNSGFSNSDGKPKKVNTSPNINLKQDVVGLYIARCQRLNPIADTQNSNMWMETDDCFLFVELHVMFSISKHMHC